MGIGMLNNLVVLASLVLSVSAISIRKNTDDSGRGRTIIPYAQVLANGAASTPRGWTSGDKRIIRGVVTQTDPTGIGCASATQCASLHRVRSDSERHMSLCTDLCDCENLLENAQKDKKRKLFDLSASNDICVAFGKFTSVEENTDIVVKVFRICTYKQATLPSGGGVGTLPSILSDCAGTNHWQNYEASCARWDTTPAKVDIDSKTGCNERGSCAHCDLAAAEIVNALVSVTQYNFPKESVSCGRRGCMQWWLDNGGAEKKYEAVRMACGAWDTEDTALSAERCAQVATPLGYSLGGLTYEFEGSTYATKGCYANDFGTYAGMVFYGAGGTVEQMKAATLGTEKRPVGYGNNDPFWVPYLVTLKSDPLPACATSGTKQCQCEWTGSLQYPEEVGVQASSSSNPDTAVDVADAADEALCKARGTSVKAKFISFTPRRITEDANGVKTVEVARCRWSVKCNPVAPDGKYGHVATGRAWRIYMDVTTK